MPYESSGVSAESLRGCLHSQVNFEGDAEKAKNLMTQYSLYVLEAFEN